MGSFRLTSCGVTDVGLKREHNEDYFFIDADRQLYVLADGMGGHASGEVASQIAVQQFVDFYVRVCRQEGFQWPYDTRGLLSFEEKAVANGIQFANDRVFIESMRDRRYDGMGTTLAVVAGAGDRLVLAHVGDSRIYRLRDGQLTQMTEDHSLLNHFKRTRNMTDDEVKSFASRNVIVRAVGLKEYVEPDVQVVEKRHGDVYLLCSDGLSDLVDDWVISQVLYSSADNLNEACNKLVRLANQGGGKDNITVIAITVEDVAVSQRGAASARAATGASLPGARSALPADTDVSSVVLSAPATARSAPRAQPEGRAGGRDRKASEPALPPPLPPAIREPRGRDQLRDTVPAAGQLRAGQLRAEPARPEAARPEAARPEAARQEPSRPEPGRAEPGQATASAATRIGSGRIGVPDAGVQVHPAKHGRDVEDETIDMSSEELRGRSGQDLRDTIRMPQAFAADQLRRMHAERDPAPPRVEGAPDGGELLGPDDTTIPLGATPASRRSASSEGRAAAPRRAQREPIPAPGSTDDGGQPGAVIAERADSLRSPTPEAISRVELPGERPQETAAGVDALVESLGGDLLDSDVTVDIALPARSSATSAFGVANDPLDPNTVIANDLLRVIFRRARVAPLPPLPLPENERDL